MDGRRREDKKVGGGGGKRGGAGEEMAESRAVGKIWKEVKGKKKGRSRMMSEYERCRQR